MILTTQHPKSQHRVKLKLFDIASRYGIAILADEPYHKQVAKEIKDRDGDVPWLNL